MVSISQIFNEFLDLRLSKWGEFEDAYSDTGEWLIDLERKVLQAGDKETLETYEEVRQFFSILCHDLFTYMC